MGGIALVALMTLLVLGTGYIGAQLVAELLDAGEEVVAVDNLFSTDAAAVERIASHPRCRFLRGNFGNPRLLAAAFAQRDITTVFCLAAQASAHPQAARPRFTEYANLLAPRILLEAMRRHGVPSLVYASSLRVYGDAAGPTTTEHATYGAFRDLSHLSKVYVEKLLEMYAALHGIRCVAARLGLVYGLSPVMKTDYRFMTAPNKFCLQLARGEVLDLRAGSERDTGFLHVGDASAALRALAVPASLPVYAPVNVATEWTSVANVAAIAAELAGSRALRPAATPVAAPTTLSIGDCLAGTGFQPRHTLRGSLAEVLDHFLCPKVGQPALGQVGP